MAQFPDTHLSLIDRIRHGDEDARKETLGVFVAGYRPALIDFLVRCKGVNQADADDLVHDFILNKIMQGKVLGLANGESRFRNALRTSLQRFLIDAFRKQSREPFENIARADEQRMQSAIDPLDRVWAIALFRNALLQMRSESPHWQLFVNRVLTQPPLGYEEIIARHGYKNPQQASNYLMTAKRTFNRILSASVKTQSSLTDSESDLGLDDEIELLRVLLQDRTTVCDLLDSVRVESDESRSSIPMRSVDVKPIPFFDASADKVWEPSETISLFEHFLDQPLADLGVTACLSGSLRDVLKEGTDLAALSSLKDFFNRRGKSGKSDLPKRVDVAITFALIALFVAQGGALAEITSMSGEDFTSRTKQLRAKPWIPDDVRNAFGRAREREGH